MRNIRYIVLAVMATVMASCNCSRSTKDEPEPNRPKSESFNLVVANIDSMGVTSWNKGVYLNIKDNQIPMLKRESERSAASEHLVATYCRVLVNDVTNCLTKGCVGMSHKDLDEIVKELNGFPNAPDYKKIIDMKKIHDEALSFAGKTLPYQRVSSYRDNYDSSAESTHQSKAQSFLNNSSVKCKVTRDKLEKLTDSKASIYQSRRRKYCEDIVECYLNSSNPEKRELNAALSKLNVYKDNGNIKSNWENIMKNHYNSLQQKK